MTLKTSKLIVSISFHGLQSTASNALGVIRQFSRLYIILDVSDVGIEANATVNASAFKAPQISVFGI